MAATLLAEPHETFRAAISSVFGWKKRLQKRGFYDANDAQSIKQLKKYLEMNPNAKMPILALHGLSSDPSIFKPWSRTLHQAQIEGKIGKIVTLKLPNDLDKRMAMVYKTVHRLSKIYRKRTGKSQVDIFGHSLGGYAGHLAAFKPNSIQIKDANGVERRWHLVGQEQRNSEVRQVISIVAPAWLCCSGQKDETSPKQKREDIYPLKIFTEKNVKTAYTKAQLKAIKKHHENIYDFVAEFDAISPNASPFPKKQITTFNKGHMGVMTDKKVCEKLISVLSH